ncbi:RNase H family protein [Roseibium sp.]|uniref:RNase H family protein n=1 Tax=Roseibium sp. TaxID=1936156 RepID=UPI003A983B2B
MGRLFDEATRQRTLFKAWQKIKSNGRRSSADETREAIEEFDKNTLSNILKIQKQLRSGTFQFDPQHGVTIKKSSGGKRGIVMASVRNRIVERALLDTLQDKSKFVRSVNTQPTSVGGVPNRSVPHGLQLIENAFADAKIHFVRSDISGFFDGIPREKVLAAISRDVGDPEFMGLLEQASTVVLYNEASLGEDRKIFPTDNEGVAQGSPLSPLFGNILLYEFDKKLNGRGVMCVRFVDDFVVMSDSEKRCRGAFKSAQKFLKDLGLECHDPYSGTSSPDKAQFGNAHSGGFSFLGYDCAPGLFQPNRKARNSLLEKVRSRIKAGQVAIGHVRKKQNSFAARSRYVQTMAVVDSVVRGWGEAFAYGNAPQTIRDLDRKIDDLLADFRAWYALQCKHMNAKDRRRTGGVGLLEDIKPKRLREAPFTLTQPEKFRKTKSTSIISTDGSTAGKFNKDTGLSPVGAWAFKNHETGEEVSGSVFETTNNRMELTAVIEAMKRVSVGSSAIIRSDSKYVCHAVNNQHVVVGNHDLWQDFRDANKGRKIRLVWVKGHAGDTFNEATDKLARRTAETALKSKNAMKFAENLAAH